MRDDDKYIYAVSRIRAKELNLLNKQFLEQLIDAKSYDECLRMLSDKGWDIPQSKEVLLDDIIKKEQDKIWNLIYELLEDIHVFDVFLYENDFHNLKAAIKENYSKKEYDGNLYIEKGTVDLNIIKSAVEKRDFSSLPDYMVEVADKAYETFFHTGDGQLLDMIVDKSMLETIIKKAKETDNELLVTYAEMKVATANLNVAIRGNLAGKTESFFEESLAHQDTLDVNSLKRAALQSIQSILDYLSSTKYSEAIDDIKESLTAFERWCDNKMIELIKPQLYNPFTLSPIAAYVIARESEIKSVRLILSGQINDFDKNEVRERLRETYV